MHIAMIGTRGVPARYGGFETAVEEIGRRLVVLGHHVTVYCRERFDGSEYMGMQLVYRPALRYKKTETLSHSLLSAMHSIRARPDAAIVFNSGNAPILPLLRSRGIPHAVHLDGLEWKRAKWSGMGQRYYAWAERTSVLRANALIADALGIQHYVESRYHRGSYFLPYGAPILSPRSDLLAGMGLRERSFHLVVSRMEPENHVSQIIEGYLAAKTSDPLIVVGSAPYAGEYEGKVRALASSGTVRLVGAVWDQDLLNQLYAHCRSYLHGHSVGGTNPSLLRAMGCGAPVTAFDVSFNREVTGGFAKFFSDRHGVARAISEDHVDLAGALDRGQNGREYVRRTYQWDEVAKGYETMLTQLTADSRRER